MKTEPEILREAPQAPSLESKLAYFCTECPWWTSRLDTCTKPEAPGPMKCVKCATPVRFTELESYLDIHRTGLTPEARQKWLGSFHENWEEYHGRPNS
jgi:hypothetical protein